MIARSDALPLATRGMYTSVLDASAFIFSKLMSCTFCGAAFRAAAAAAAAAAEAEALPVLLL